MIVSLAVSAKPESAVMLASAIETARAPACAEMRAAASRLLFVMGMQIATRAGDALMKCAQMHVQMTDSAPGIKPVISAQANARSQRSAMPQSIAKESDSALMASAASAAKTMHNVTGWPVNVT